MNKWDRRGLELAQHVAGWSKDPSTQTGCVILRPDHTVATVGYNGFPRGVEDSDERLNDRPFKHQIVVHAEPNAVLSAHERLDGCTAYVWPWPPCPQCASLLIQAGIVRIVCPGMQHVSEAARKHWGDSMMKTTPALLHEAGVELVIV